MYTLFCSVYIYIKYSYIHFFKVFKKNTRRSRENNENDKIKIKI